MNILVVGLGSIAKRHIKNIKKIHPEASIIVWHTHSKQPNISNISEEINRSVYSFDDAIKQKPDIAFITNPSTNHVPVGILLAERGIDLFIEKPLSADVSGIDTLLNAAQAHKSLIMVGYNFRFHPPFLIMKDMLDSGNLGKILSIRAEVGQYLPDWRPGTDYRMSVSAQKKLGGGAVLELSHELDYVRWLAGEVTSVSAKTDHLSDLAIDVEDTAEIILRFANAAIGSVHLDMVQRIPARYCRVVGSEGTMIWEGTDDSVRCYLHKTGQWSLLHPSGKVDRNDMYLAELEHFFSCVKTRTQPDIDGDTGKRIVEIASAIQLSAKEQRTVFV